MKKLLIPSSILVLIVLGIIFHFASPEENPTLVSSNTPVVTPSTTTTSPTSTPSQVSSSNSVTTTPTPTTTGFKDGTFTGSDYSSRDGDVQIAVVISKGKIMDIQFITMPSNFSTSSYITSQVTPLLKQEAISAQSANIDNISGASITSALFQQSLASALSQAS